ncbi:zinc-dependent metalloprotease [Nakamurella lactea]|uniref:zinc-dependent metalloprotease n=1 Tax=Nakamurella lactea TaxID=459515 RepID=UPI00048F6A68|nr:zinc-dependent metalloprotease [Nakamurella lactea]
MTPEPPSPVDWSAAVRSATRFAPTGPSVTPAQAAAAVAELRQFARESELTVREVTGLGAGLPVADAEVVDRPAWIEATADGMAELTAPLTRKLGSQVSTAGRTAAGAQVGVVLGFLSGRVLGQYDPLGESTAWSGRGDEQSATGGSRQAGRLLLVVPNIIKVERELKVDSADFRRWVCLHEGTHRLQFTAVPWLRDYFVGQVAEFGAVADLDARELLGRLADAVRGGRRDDRQSWIEKMQSPEQRVVFDRMMALMSLLEGHADHVMDAVGTQVVPSVAAIRSAFTRRRKKGAGPIDRLLRSLLGMDMKMSQYIKGEAFVSQVVSRAGMDAFNTVWSAPEALPSRAEIADPAAWMARVLG